MAEEEKWGGEQAKNIATPYIEGAALFLKSSNPLLEVKFFVVFILILLFCLLLFHMVLFHYFFVLY